MPQHDIVAADSDPRTLALPPTRDVSLDFVRGIAILLAMGWHLNGAVHDPEPGLISLLLAPGRSIGWAGVDMFFVLSGFLVGGLVFQEHYGIGAFDARRFLVRRALKIWPVLYAFVGLQLIAQLRPWDTYLLQTLLHVQNYFVTPLNHLWSLAVEEHFYLVFAAGFTLYARRTVQLRRIPTLLVFVMVTVFLLRCIAGALGVDAQSLQWETHFRIDSLACGVLLAYFRIYRPAVFEPTAWQRTALLTLFLAGFAWLSTAPPHGEVVTGVGYSIAYLSSACLLLATFGSRLVVQRNVVVRCVAWIGVYSYALYVFHLGAARIVAALWLRAGMRVDSLELIAIKYAAAIAAAVLVTKLVERPFLALRDRLYPRRASAF